MFNHNLVETIFLLTVPLLLMAALPFVMAWLEQPLNHQRVAVRPAENEAHQETIERDPANA